MFEVLFESIYNKSHVYSLKESRKIRSAEDFFNGEGIRYLAGLLGGKKSIPSFFLDENHKEYLTSVINKVLGSSIFKNDINFASDQTIAFIVKVSKTPENLRDLLHNHFDTVVEYGSCCNSDWFKKSEFVKQILDAPEYSSDNMHKLEKYLQVEHSKRSKSKSIKTSNANSLYDVLYDDGTWKLCVPKNFEGDVELSSHIEFTDIDTETDQDKIFHKTKWCTAANKTYYDMYTNDGNLPLYVIQYYKNGKYTNAWQIAFCHRDYEDEPKGHIEIMNAADVRDWEFLFNCPKELVSKITDTGLLLYKGEYILNLLDLINNINSNIVYEIEEGDPLDYEYHEFLDWKEVQGLIPGYEKGQIYQTSDLQLLKSLEDYDNIKVSFIVPKGEAQIYEGQFSFNKSLYSITIPDGVTAIHSFVFEGCPNLEIVNMPNSVEEIGEGAFAECNNLKQIVLPKGLTEIKSDTFRNCYELEKINIPGGVRIISTDAFAVCKSLKEIYIPDSVEEIGYFAFGRCYELEKVVIGNGIRELNHGAFAFDLKLKDVSVPKYLFYGNTFNNAKVTVRE